MKRPRFLFFLLLLTFCIVNFSYAAPVDLNDGWTQYDKLFSTSSNGPGQWVISSDGTSVTQNLNSDQTFFVGSNIYSSFQGSFGQTESYGYWDDDLIGFVFGFQDTANYTVLDWRQASSPAYVKEGFRIRKYGTDGGLIYEQYGDIGWSDNTVYNFTLNTINTDIKISISDASTSTSIFNYTLLGDFDNLGRVGFYGESQEGVVYTAIDGVVYVPTGSGQPVPEPATMILLGTGLVGLAGFRKRTKRA